MIRDLGEIPGEKILQLSAVHLGGFDRSIGDSHGFAAALGTCEHPVLAVDGYRFCAAFWMLKAIGHTTV
ncbi:hypothetical protein [Leisingera sp. ANG-M1]|uniref:hypothetical protein n=1 Tax=Leisingera sp. ANG-M1 TaxID=1577895 RepID=UPI0019D3A834|nr:hypothetical protein [Leisingera sp. ANG-M1]